jgi:hypothetical protein
MVCPIDGLILALPTFVRIGQNGTDTDVGDHIHMGITLNATCANGHQWRTRETFLLERIA